MGDLGRSRNCGCHPVRTHIDRRLARWLCHAAVAAACCDLRSRSRRGGSGKQPLGKALRYTLGQWPKLIVFLTHGEVPLDNNRCENAIRPFVLGRKGWLFSDTVKGAQASANLYSLVETAKANSVELHAYLSLLFTQLPYAKTIEDFEALLPWNVKASSR